MDLDSETTVDEGDYLALYTGTMGENGSGTVSSLMERITSVLLSGERYIVSYIPVSEEDMRQTMDVYQKENVEGEDLLEEALTSIYDSCRNEALSVLDSWPDKNWSPRMRLALVKAGEMSQHPLLKLRVDVLLKKRTLDFANFLDVIHEHQKVGGVKNSPPWSAVKAKGSQ